MHTLLSPNLIGAEPRNLLLTGGPGAPNVLMERLEPVLRAHDGDVEEMMAKDSF